MELLKIIAIFFVVFYAVKYLFRLLLPFALRKMGEKLMQKAQQSAYQGKADSSSYTQGSPFDHFKQQAPKKDGELRVEYVPEEDSKSRKGPQTAGEFVDFEEIK